MEDILLNYSLHVCAIIQNDSETHTNKHSLKAILQDLTRNEEFYSHLLKLNLKQVSQQK